MAVPGGGLLGRSDGFIVEQDGGDKFIRDNKIKQIRRTLYAKWHSSILIPKRPKGETEINQKISPTAIPPLGIFFHWAIDTHHNRLQKK